MRALRLAAVLSALVGGSTTAIASVDHYDVQHGLSQGSVVAIESDARGFVWIGTEDGLNRFDGHAFKVFRSEPGQPGLPDSFVQALARVDETLWIGTIGGGLARMDLRSERIEALAQRLPASVPATQTIFALLPLGPDRALVGTTDGVHEVVWPLDGTAARSRRLDAPGKAPRQLVRALAQLPDGQVLVGGAEGVCVLDAAFTDCRDLAVPWPAGARPAEAMAASADASGRIWVAFGTVGIARLQPADGSAQWLQFGGLTLPAQVSRVSALRAVGDGDLWIGSDAGTYRYRADCDCVSMQLDQEPGDDAGARKIVYALHADDEQRVWIGAWNHGLDRYDPQRQAIERWSPRLEERPDARGRGVRALVPDGERVWLGVYGLGVVEAKDLKPGTAAFTQPPSLRPASIPQSLVWALAKDARGQLWIGSDGGLSRWNPRDGLRVFSRDGGDSTPARPLRSVRALLLDRAQRLWIGGEDGLFRLDTGDPSARVQLVASEADELPDRRIFALHEDGRGQHWIGTWRGVYPFDARSGRVGAALAPGAHLRLTWDIADADDGGLWIGSSDGLVHVAPDGRWRRYTERDGFPNRVIYSIERDREGRLWLSTNRGVVRFDPRDGHTVSFGLQDQLQHTEFLFGAHAQDSAGRLLFGGPAGFNRIDPAKVAQSGQVPRPVLTGIRIDHHEIEPGDRIALAVPMLDRLVVRPGDGVVELHYGAIAHDQPREMRFRYRLVGYDPGWQDAGDRRFATYTNLPPGQFVFEVEAIGRFGQRSTAPRRLQVESLPWWWETTAFRLALALLLLLALAVVVRWRLADLNRQRESLRLQVTERTAQIEQQRDELAQANAELDKLSRLDTLTGLANRRALLGYLADAVSSARAQATSLAVALVDLDHFKRINDSRGHAVGDLALQHLARLWQSGLPAGALFGRYGGEEFLLVLPQTDAIAATAVMDELLMRLRTRAVPDIEPDLRLSASAGVAMLLPQDGVESLIHRADQALYQAKASGRDRCATAD